MVYPLKLQHTQLRPDKSQTHQDDYVMILLKLQDRINALGDFVVAHLFLGIPKGAAAADSARIKSKIDSLYAQLKAGAKFEDLVKINSEIRILLKR